MKNEFELQDGNVDSCFNFDDLFQNLWHWHIHVLFNDLTRILAFSTIWLNFPQYVEVFSVFVIRVRFD